MNNMKLLSVVTTPSIYHGFSNRKMLREANFTQVNIKTCDCCNVRKHREIKNCEQYIALDIYLKFGNLDKVKIKSLEPKDYLG